MNPTDRVGLANVFQINCCVAISTFSDLLKLGFCCILIDFMLAFIGILIYDVIPATALQGKRLGISH